MRTVNEKGYVNIQAWMINDLDLKGNELIVYAIIFGHSQNDDNCYNGSLQTLANWCGCSKSTIQTIIQKFVDNGLITKNSYTKNNITFCEYRTEQRYGIPRVTTNNIIINNTNIDNDISNTNIPSVAEGADFEFGVKKPKKNNLYQQCISMINDFTPEPKERKALVEYLDYRISVKDKPLYANMWSGMLKKLDAICCSMDTETFVEYIREVLCKGWLSFYDLDVKNTTRDDLPKQKKADKNNKSSTTF